MPSIPHRTIYYLPGHGGKLATGLGQGLMDRGFNVTGRETRDAFRQMPFDEQVLTIRDDLQEHFWSQDARVVCNSFGSYLFLHAQAGLAPFPGRVLLLSPITNRKASAKMKHIQRAVTLLALASASQIALAGGVLELVTNRYCNENPLQRHACVLYWSPRITQGYSRDQALSACKNTCQTGPAGLGGMAAYSPGAIAACSTECTRQSRLDN